MSRRLVKVGHRTVGYSPEANRLEIVVEISAEGVNSLHELVEKLSAPCVV